MQPGYTACQDAPFIYGPLGSREFVNINVFHSGDIARDGNNSERVAFARQTHSGWFVPSGMEMPLRGKKTFWGDGNSHCFGTEIWRLGVNVEGITRGARRN